MKLKNLWLSLPTFTLLSVLLLATVGAAWPNLPFSSVTITVADGTNSYFLTTLSGVPTGYDVSNGEYLGWCVDVRYTIPRSPATHVVMLYSSCDPPVDLATERWDMVNYISNNKQGEMLDIQHAIWYFVKMNGDPLGWWIQPGYTLTTAAMDMVNDALANGDGFVPGPNDVVAVICYPDEETQFSIIEFRTRAPQPVGGEATSIKMPPIKSQLQTPWIWLKIVIFSIGATVIFLKFKKKKQ